MLLPSVISTARLSEVIVPLASLRRVKLSPAELTPLKAPDISPSFPKFTLFPVDRTPVFPSSGAATETSSAIVKDTLSPTTSIPGSPTDARIDSSI